MTRPFLAALLLVLGSATLADAALAADRCGKLGTIERWVGDFTLGVSEDSEFAPPGAGASLYRKFRWNASGRIELGPHYQDGERSEYAWSGEEQTFTATVRDVEGGHADPATDSYVELEASQLDSNQNSGHLALHCDKGEYRLGLHIGDFLLKRRLRMPAAVEAVCKAAGGKDESQLPAAMLCGILKSEQEKFERDKLTFSVSVSSDNAKDEAVKLDAKTMTLTGKPLPFEAVIVTNDLFRKWIPEANKNSPTQAGNFVQVDVKLRRKDKPDEPAGEKAKFEFELLDVSHNPGWCVNAPLQGDTEADLRIEAAANKSLEVPEPHRAQTKEDALGASVLLSAFDMGAHARLKVRVTTVSGQRLVAFVDGKPGVTELRVPLDDDDNQVADAWQDKEGVAKGLPATWDHDEPMQKRLGDGYTLYEEYRGFQTLAGHVRTRPAEKDLFVYDAYFLVHKYYEPFNPAQLKIRYIDPSLMKYSGVPADPEHRWVNFNSLEQDRYARQYAMVVNAAPLPAGKAGCARLVGAECNYDPVLAMQALKNTYAVDISPDNVMAAVSALKGVEHDALYLLQIQATVMHEMMHALEVEHHSAGGKATAQNMSDGVVGCVMRYLKDAEYSNAPMQRVLCRKGETWQHTWQEIGADGKIRHMAMPAHDCWGQIDVMTDPD